MFAIVVSCLLVIITIYIFLQKSSRKHSPFRGRGLCITYWPKWLRHSMSIKLWRINHPKRINNYNPDSLSYEHCGVVPSPEDEDLESPKSLITDRHEDGIFIWGGDDRGRVIVAKLVRLSRRRASAFLLVRDSDGHLYTLPNQPDSNVVNVSNDQCWRGNGLLLECVEPMRTWRVKFNGLLRKGKMEEYITDDKDDNDEEEQDSKKGQNGSILHARIDFLWKAMRAPVDLWQDSCSGLLAHALARESKASLSSIKALDRDGYDQWGALHGTLKIGQDATQKWYLRGGRQHRWGMSDSATNLQVSINIFNYFASGDILWLEGFSYNTGISHCVMGYLQTAAGRFHPISSSSLDLSELESNKDTQNIFLKCKAGGKSFHLWHRLLEGVAFYTGDPWTLKHNVRPTYAASPLYGGGWGLVFMSNRFSGLCPVPEREALNLPTPKEPVDADLVLDLSDGCASSVPLTGGKGSSLASLKYIETQTEDQLLKFSVPNGVVVSSHAWEKQIASSPELKGAISHLEKAVTSCHTTRIKESCQKMKQTVDALQISPEILRSLTDKLASTFPENLHEKRFAVRSSACGEDSSEASSAGQNETVLGCFWNEGDFSTPTSILRALVSCWGSQFSFQSVEYRRQRGQLVNDGMAVVIQEMVPAKVAGVMFTREPVTGSPASILITANYGLGESVVSASAEPDSVVVRRTWRNKLRVQSKSVGEKKKMHIMKDSGGTDEVEVATGDREITCLSDDDALKLACIGIYIEDYFGSPRDIEFALIEDSVFLLQARPLTVLDEWTDYELIHEADAGFGSDKEISTIANVGEVMNGYICPLTLSISPKMLDLSIQRDFRQREWPYYTFDPYRQRNVLSSQGHCFLNMGEISYRGNDPEISMVNKAIDLAVFGRLITTPEIHRWAVNRFGVMTSFAKFVRTGYAFYDMFFNSRRVNKCKPIYSSYEIPTNRVTSAAFLFKEICMKLPELSKICECHCHSSSASAMSQCIAFAFMAENKGDITPSLIQDISSLLSCVSETESADVPTSLKKLAQTIAHDEEVVDFLSMTSDEGRVWLESHPESVGEEFRMFLQRHGHRCIKEFDLRALSWGLAPETLVATLQMMVKNPQSFLESKKASDLEHAIDVLKTPLPSSKRRALKFILNLCKNSVSLRENTKSLVIKTVDAFRKAFRILGQVMVSECRLPDEDLIFFLQHREIGLLLRTRSARIVSKAIRRRKLMSQMEALDFPEICYGVPQPIISGTSIEIGEGSEEDVMRGTPVCFGVTTGSARVITSFQDASQIQNGDILITFSTDIGWTPYFPLLGGVVTEIGGLISHGAVVAREYGLPCVIGVKGATKKFKTGDKVLLNGEEGFIKKISRNSQQSFPS